MDDAKRELVKDRLTIARSDLDSARILGSAPHSISTTAAFHCQQAAEKGIKAFLVFRDQRFSKTHALLPLVEIAEPIEGRFSTWRDAADDLSHYAVESRYPESFRIVTKEEFDQALQSATDIYTFVLSLLPTDVHPTR